MSAFIDQILSGLALIFMAAAIWAIFNHSGGEDDDFEAFDRRQW